jgi:UDP-N-acetylmuramate: L-alanyl-gamma-D-glutamyl-meso-diaminopimelate ligase
MMKQSYGLPEHVIREGKTYLMHGDREIPLKIFGHHNLLNLEGARRVCNLLDVTDDQFYNAIATYRGAANRLELVAEKEGCSIFRDFAHAPSKLKATLEAVKEQFTHRRLIATFELHTYSSLNKDFLTEYSGSMDKADVAVVYFSPHALELKKLPMLRESDVRSAFGRKDLHVFAKPSDLETFLLKQNWDNTNLLMMSSGNYDGLNIKEIAGKLYA